MPSTRRQKAEAAAAMPTSSGNDPHMSEEDHSSDEEEDAPRTFTFQGKTYTTYEEMVEAKRERNRQRLESSGLLQASANLRDEMATSKKKSATKRGIKSDAKKRKAAEPLPRRKSGRIAGVKADGFYVEDERAGRFTISGQSSYSSASGAVSAGAVVEDLTPRFFNDRINDGSDITVKDAAEYPGAKWLKDHTVPAAERFMGEILPALSEKSVNNTKSPRSVSLKTSPATKKGGSVASLSNEIGALSVDDENCVSKVVPDRIYSVTCHPSPSSLIVCAGDKQGHVGLWNVDQKDDEKSDTDGVHLFKPHNRVVTHLEWNKSGTSLLSASYDGSVRLFDIQTQSFQEIFATYDDDSSFKGKLGYNLDTGYGYWTQYFCLDPRSADDRCLFLSTSKGTVMHADLRTKGKITFHQELSEKKKINSISLHPDGNIMATAGLDCTVKLWDIRKFKTPKTTYKPTTGAKPLVTQQAGKSVNSAFFSPSGKTLVSTTMNNYLDLSHNMHTKSGSVKADIKIRHDNHTGRWLSTFMAQWHPTMTSSELFVCGSMRQPRTVELFDGTKGKLLRGVNGESLTAVVSRCCIHPSEDRLIVVGGNSSGRVTVAR